MRTIFHHFTKLFWKKIVSSSIIILYKKLIKYLITLHKKIPKDSTFLYVKKYPSYERKSLESSIHVPHKNWYRYPITKNIFPNNHRASKNLRGKLRIFLGQGQDEVFRNPRLLRPLNNPRKFYERRKVARNLCLNCPRTVGPVSWKIKKLLQWNGTPPLVNTCLSLPILTFIKTF